MSILAVIAFALWALGAADAILCGMYFGIRPTRNKYWVLMRVVFWPVYILTLIGEEVIEVMKRRLK